jgi:hypothetical protein
MHVTTTTQTTRKRSGNEVHIEVRLPWPTYASVPAAKVARVASEMGFVAEALNYEQRLFEDDRRPEVIAALEEEHERLQAEQELTAVTPE